jgi:pescadillo protein
VPKLKLDNIIKERYPTFVDALRDLDDALSMLFLFANLPSHQYVPAKTIALCQRLCLEFEHYVIVSHSLRKSFLSIKGIYYQATIQGQDILWLVPYRFVQRTAGDIDFRIMGTFIEFYTTLLGFVNFRLYTSVGLVYPPKFNAKSDAEGGELGAFQLEGKGISREDETMTNGNSQPVIASAEAQAKADKVATLAATEEQEKEPADQAAATEETDNTEAIDTFEPTAQDADVLPQPQASSSERGTMFAPFTFYLSRETPRAPLEFLLKSFGCKRVGWDPILGDGAFTTDESDPAITHQIVDRPTLPTDSLPQVPNVPETESGGAARPKAQWPRSTMPGRTYVQPQWVWDCINQGKLLRPDLYAPGAELPPHLSPWVKPKKGQYDPNLPLEAQELEGEAEAFEDVEHVDESMIGPSTGAQKELSALERESSVEAGEGMDVDNSDSDSEEDEEDEDEEAVGEWDGIESEAESDISEGEVARRQHQRELEAEATGVPLETEAPTTKSKNAEIRKKAEKKRRAEQEEKERQKMMLSLRKRKLVERIEHGTTKRDKEAEALRMKKRRIEKAKAAANAL